MVGNTTNKLSVQVPNGDAGRENNVGYCGWEVLSIDWSPTDTQVLLNCDKYEKRLLSEKTEGRKQRRQRSCAWSKPTSCGPRSRYSDGDTDQTRSHGSAGQLCKTRYGGSSSLNAPDTHGGVLSEGKGV